MLKSKIRNVEPEEVAAVQAAFGVTPPWPSTRYARALMELGPTPLDATALFRRYLDQFPGQTTEEKVYESVVRDKDRGLQVFSAYQQGREALADDVLPLGPGGPPPGSDVEHELEVAGLTVADLVAAVAAFKATQA